ncbi:hypothetical protein MHB65_19980 [Lysinibacillus sp. FSL K6-0075]|uniref:hypothetical protein n=1 Tax=Lysinibacillus sp. FSL K6-0075 TaxID=2921415 RepID=UPI00315950A6
MEELNNSEVLENTEVETKTVETVADTVETKEETNTEEAKVVSEEDFNSLKTELDTIKALLGEKDLKSILTEFDSLKNFKTEAEEVKKQESFKSSVTELLNGRKMSDTYRKEIEYTNDPKVLKERVDTVYQKMVSELQKEGLLSTIGQEGANPSTTSNAPKTTEQYVGDWASEFVKDI